MPIVEEHHVVHEPGKYKIKDKNHSRNNKCQWWFTRQILLNFSEHTLLGEIEFYYGQKAIFSTAFSCLKFNSILQLKFKIKIVCKKYFFRLLINNLTNAKESHWGSGLFGLRNRFYYET
jgi:hypothetical protein